MYFFLIKQHSKFLWHTLQALYMCTLCDSTNINTKIEFVPNCLLACQRVAFSLPVAAILVNCAPSGEMHNYCTQHIIKENFENFLIHRCNYILLSQVYCVWQVVKTPTVILNNPVLFFQNTFFFPLQSYIISFEFTLIFWNWKGHAIAFRVVKTLFYFLCIQLGIVLDEVLFYY